MDKKQRRLRLRIIIPAIILWLTANLYYFWIKISGAIFLLTGLIELMCFLTVIIATIVLIFRLIRQPDWRNTKNYLTFGFIIFVFSALNIPQLKPNEDTLQSPVKIRACYEGTMNTSHLYLRENGSFEDFNIGWFALVHYYKGNWDQRRDTLYLEFEGEKPVLLGEKIIIKDDLLYTLKGDALAPTYYYLGHCKGLN